MIAASAGNHALALAYHGKMMNIPVTVVMPTTAPIVKISRCEMYGATIVLHGEDLGEVSIIKKLQFIRFKLRPAWLLNI